VKDIYQVLREKELVIERLRKEIAALRSVVPLLAEEGDPALESPEPPPAAAGEWRDVFSAQANKRR
jgi:hypothetical protein